MSFLRFTHLNYKALYSYQNLRNFITFRIFDPFIHYLFFAILGSAVVGNDYYKYMVIGNVCFYTFQTMIVNLISMFRFERYNSTLELNIASSMPTILIIVKKGIMPMLDSFYIFVSGLLISSVFFKITFPVDHFYEIIILISVTIFAIFCFSLILASFSLLFSNVNLFLNIILSIIQIFCGINFSISLFPDLLQNLVRFLPLTNSVLAIRSIFGFESNNNIYSLLLNELYIGILYFLIAIILIYYMEKVAMKKGSLFKNL